MLCCSKNGGRRPLVRMARLLLTSSPFTRIVAVQPIGAASCGLSRSIGASSRHGLGFRTRRLRLARTGVRGAFARAFTLPTAARSATDVTDRGSALTMPARRLSANGMERLPMASNVELSRHSAPPPPHGPWRLYLASAAPASRAQSAGVSMRSLATRSCITAVS